MPTDYDSPWKDAIQQYLRPFLELCFSHVERELDWSRAPEFLEQELRESIPGADLGPQRVDQLVKAWRPDGEEQWLLLHIEVQSNPDPDLPRRLFQYHTRLTEKHGWRVTTLCLLADISPGYRPTTFTWELLGCSHEFRFPTCKLLDFSESELQTSPNPLSLIIRAHLAAKRTRLEEPLRYSIKRALLKELPDRGLTRQDFEQLLKLIDWLIRLSPASEVDFSQEIREYYGTKPMPYVTSFERIGLLEGTRKAILRVASSRFGAVPEAFAERLALIRDATVLDTIIDLVSRSESLADLEKGLDTLGV
jgi:hypothetical protein